MDERWYEKTFYKWFFLIYCFFAVFFPLGFYTLLAGPSKWIIDYSLRYSWSEDTEKNAQKTVILLLIFVSFILTFFIRKFILSKMAAWTKYVLMTLLTGIFVVSVYFFTFRPDVFIDFAGGRPGDRVESGINNSGQNIEFVLGAYPDFKELRRLKEAGYTAVVSLLDELVVPAEPALIVEEYKNAKMAGIPLIRIPMLPWVSGNNEAILKIRELASKGHGKYFVHCYLGRDRVNVFRKIVRDIGANSVSLQQEIVRHIDDLPRFERGDYIKISPQLYITPFPTDDEFFGYIVNGQFNAVVSLLDPGNPTDTVWIDKERKILHHYGVRYVNIPVRDSKDTKNIELLLDSLKHIPLPYVIHKYSANDPIYQILKNKLLVVRGKVVLK